MDKELQKIRQRFVEAAGHTTQSLGKGRVVGQIFAHLYLNPEPQSLDDLTQALGISKGSASMAVRQLASWGSVNRVWVKGDRKDYFEATDEFGTIARKALFESIAEKIALTDELLSETEETLQSRKKKDKKLDSDWQFLEKRLKRFRAFRDRIQWLWEKVVINLLSDKK